MGAAKATATSTTTDADAGAGRYALSDRLVCGILQAADRAPPGAPANTVTDGNDKANDKAKEEASEKESALEGSSLDTSVGSTGGFVASGAPATPAGYAQLAYAVLVRGPALCCRPGNAADLDKIASFLGSYDGGCGGGERRRGGSSRGRSDGSRGGGADGGDGADGDDGKDAASRWEDGVLARAAEAYVRDMIEMGKISGGARGDGGIGGGGPAPVTEDEKQERDDGEEEEEWDSIGDGSSSSSPPSPIPPSASANSLEEIFAEESDPDDFEYEGRPDGLDGPAAATELELAKLEESFDPRLLSRPNGRMGWDGARDRLAALLEELAYGRLVHLPASRWAGDGGVSATLAELTRALLDADIARTSSSNDDDRPVAAVVKTETLLRRPAHLPPSASLSALTAQWPRPLAALRDRALDGGHSHDALGVYVGFVKDLLNASPPPRTGGGGGVASDGRPNPTKVVGLASLSALCGHDGVLRTKSGVARRRVRESVIESIDGIIDLVEGVRHSAGASTSVHTTQTTNTRRDLPSAFITDDDNGTERSPSAGGGGVPSEWIRVVVGILPIIQYLTNTQLSDYGRLDWSDASATLSRQEAQSLLSTGLFRELVLLQAAAAREQTDGAVAVTRNRLLRAIFVLSAQSESVLGKYATRVDVLTSQIHSSDFLENNLVDATLWAALSANLQSEAKSTLRLRGAAVLPSIDKLNRDCLLGLVTLCERVDEALQAMISSSDRDGGSVKSKSNESRDQVIDDAPYHFVEFTNCIANLPAIAKSLVKAVSSVNGGTEKTTQRLDVIRESLALASAKKLSSPAPVPGKDHESEERGVEDEEADTSASLIGRDTGEDKKTGQINAGIVSSIRKGVKIVSLLLEAGSSESSDISSKTD